jgi:hypothetical protein
VTGLIDVVPAIAGAAAIVLCAKTSKPWSRLLPAFSATATTASPAKIASERRVHGVTREALSAASTGLLTVKARAEAQGQVQAETIECLKRVEAELVLARSAAGAAREEAAKPGGCSAS